MVSKKSKKKKAEVDKKISIYAIVRIRGSIDMRTEIKDTFDMLRLNRVNHCVIVPSTPSYRGMIRKTQEGITWGEISLEMLEKLITKRGKFEGKPIEKTTAKEITKKIMDSQSVKDIKVGPVFRLSPPKKGYKAIRRTFPKGSLGYRGESINELLQRMI